MLQENPGTEHLGAASRESVEYGTFASPCLAFPHFACAIFFEAAPRSGTGTQLRTVCLQVPSQVDMGDVKELLEHDLLTGAIPLESSRGFMPKDIHQMRPEYEAIPYKNWTSRLYNARRRHRKQQEQAVNHSAALERSRAINPKKSHNEKGEPRWEGSSAAAFLSVDVADGKHIGVSKALLRQSRPEYMEFSQPVFRGHVHQEVKTQKFRKQRKSKHSQSERSHESGGNVAAA